jgi:hypothetical protein
MKLNSVACQFVDSADGRPIPLVTATATDNTVVVSDNAGYIHIPVSLSQGTSYYLNLVSPGYDVPSDGFGYNGIQLKVGTKVKQISLHRTNIAQRSGRVTGIGKYIHAQTLGVIGGFKETPLTGMDSVQTADINGKRYVFFGDTNWTGYPLGNFRTTTGAVRRQSRLPNCPYLIEYHVDVTGKARQSVAVSDSMQGVSWISGVITIGDSIIGYANHRKSLDQQLAHGFVRWNSSRKMFDDFQAIPENSWKHLDGHPILFRENMTEFVLFGHAIPNFRVPADLSKIRSGQSFETFTCLLANGDIDTDTAGTPNWRWRLDGTPIDAEGEIAYLKSGKLKRQHCRHLLSEFATKRTVIPHRGSVHWNAYLGRWLLVFTAINEPDSVLGEVFITAGSSPIGPWSECIRVATHPKYSFYNPLHHEWLDQQGGKLITIEGTYTTMFSGNTVPTPQYEYNQLTYTVDLGDARLAYLRSPIND